MISKLSLLVLCISLLVDTSLAAVVKPYQMQELSNAIRDDDVEEARSVLEKLLAQENMQILKADWSKELFYLALTEGSIKTVQVFLDKLENQKEDIWKPIKSLTVGDKVQEFCAFEIATLYGKESVVRLFIEKAKVEGATEEIKFMDICESLNKLIGLSQLLLSDERLQDLLLYAVRNSWVPVVRLLLEKGVKRNDGDLFQAALYGGNPKELLALLIKYKADNINGKSLLSLHTPLISAVTHKERNLEIIEQILMAEPKPDITETDTNGNTALYHAVKARSLPIVQLLLLHGAEVNVSVTNLLTPLRFAVREDYQEIVSALLNSAKTEQIIDEVKIREPKHETLEPRSALVFSLLQKQLQARMPIVTIL